MNMDIEPLIDKFTMNDKAELEDWYFDPPVGKIKYHYNSEMFDYFYTKIRNKQSDHYIETDQWLYDSLEKYSIKNKRVLIIGSESPWYESIALFYDAKEVVVFEYSEIYCNVHYNLKYINIKDSENYNDFDVAFSISSFEHDGLGRYGDPIDPYADLNSMKNLKNKMKKDGILFLSVPVGKDKIVWNAHRIYGEHRFFELIKGWEILDIFSKGKNFNDRMNTDTGKRGCYQPVIVLKNI